jgi:putrescine---pyruvate transaminase
VRWATAGRRLAWNADAAVSGADGRAVATMPATTPIPPAAATATAGGPAGAAARPAAPGPLLYPFARPAASGESLIRIVAGEGAHVVDDAGRRYIDALASLWYCAVGHGRREIIDAVGAQLGRLDAFHLFERFTNPPAEALAARLAALAPMADARVFFANGGSEAVDAAIKLARIAHGQAGAPERTIVVSRAPSYHGVTFGGTSLTGLPANQAGFGPLVGDVCQVGKDDLAAVEAVMVANPGRVAAVVAEPVIGAGGVHPPAEGYLTGLRALCDAHGAFLVLDEVITGFGRLGSWFGAAHFGVRPDLVTFAKAVTSGYQPLGGVLVGPAVHAPLSAHDDFVLRTGGTYAGHPVACAAALANLDVLEGDGLVERAGTVGARLAAGLRGLAARHELADVRGAGAMWAVELPAGRPAAAARDAMLERGVICRPIGSSVLAFCPPLMIAETDVDACVDALDAVLAAG